jgi:hypothetical protein
VILSATPPDTVGANTRVKRGARGNVPVQKGLLHLGDERHQLRHALAVVDLQVP